ncbi:MAG: DedA family protein [Spirochaetia bacterium]|nr:DedA family protein [Spirochaetia bacterium]
MDLQTWLDWIHSLPEWGIYTFIGVSSFIENVFPPWPGDTFNVVSGVLAANGGCDIRLLMVAVMAGNLIAAYVKYYLGIYMVRGLEILNEKIRRPQFVKRWLSQLTSRESLEKTHKWFDRWGFPFVIVSRFFAVVRFFVSIVAGMTRMNIVLYTISFSIGAAIWNGILLWGGFALGKNWGLVMEYMAVYNKAAMVVLISVLLAFAVYKFRTRDKAA